MTRDWTPHYMRNGFVEEVREKRAEQGLDPREKPTYNWLRENGFRQFLRRARELGYTPDEFLYEECGFEEPSTDWPCTNPETVRYVENWLDYHREVGERINGTSVSDAASHLRRCMEIGEEYVATSDLLEFGRGERVVCAHRAKLMMNALTEEFENSGTRQNYATTLRDFLEAKYEEGVIEHNPFPYLVADAGWTHERSRPEHVMSTDVVNAYFDACESRVEQMLILSLAGNGLRPSDFEGDERLESYRFDAEVPHIEFTNDRKNGVGRVPIVVGAEFIEEDYFGVLQQAPNYEGHIFPSDHAETGCRTPEWIRRKVAEIGARTDATLSNGEKPKPDDFRNFWYSLFSKAYQEWIANADVTASIQGSSSGRVAAESYFDDDGWFSHFIRYVRPKLEEAFPAEIEPADELGNIDVDIDLEVAEDPASSPIEQVELDAFNKDETGAYYPLIARLRSRLCVEHAAATASEEVPNYPPSLGQAGLIGCGLVGWAVAVGVFWGLHGGISVDPTSGSVGVAPGLIMGLILGFLLVFRDIPELEVPTSRPL